MIGFLTRMAYPAIRTGISSSLMVPLISVAVIAASSFGIYLTSSLKSAGATEAEFERLSTLVEERTQLEADTRERLEHSLTRIAEYERQLGDAKLESTSHKRQIELIPEPDGKPVICPINCILQEIPNENEPLMDRILGRVFDDGVRDQPKTRGKDQSDSLSGSDPGRQLPDNGSGQGQQS